MANDYPVPNYAAYIWLNGSSLCLGLPGPGPGASLATFPNTTQGLALALNVLRARERQPNELRLGHQSAPTQWEIDKWLKDAGRMSLPKDPEAAAQLLTQALLSPQALATLEPGE